LFLFPPSGSTIEEAKEYGWIMQTQPVVPFYDTWQYFDISQVHDDDDMSFSFKSNLSNRFQGRYGVIYISTFLALYLLNDSSLQAPSQGCNKDTAGSCFILF